MADTNTGGAAFPNQKLRTNGDDGCGMYAFDQGMTLRDYFAAKAPVDIPHWFEINYNEIGECPACVVVAELNDNPWPACENQNEINAWHEKAMKIRYFQWRYSYADSMLEARKA